MTRDPSQDLADVLEVYLLCLLLGFQGRYSATNRDELGLWTSRVRDQVTRIRGGTGLGDPHGRDHAANERPVAPAVALCRSGNARGGARALHRLSGGAALRGDHRVIDTLRPDARLMPNDPVVQSVAT